MRTELRPRALSARNQRRRLSRIIHRPRNNDLSDSRYFVRRPSPVQSANRGIQSPAWTDFAIFLEIGMRSASSSQYITEEQQLRADLWRPAPRQSSGKSRRSTNWERSAG